ncbi:MULTISPECIES: potassium channel protein [Ramlibacter]|uniref:potassium channel family protein n=1 Tax=Ramlibacter TaxID=174951 RepID=UPI00257C37FC|nr:MULTISPECIES: potassium channel protein [Ramlibacter]
MPLKKILRSRHLRGLATGTLILVGVHVVGTLGYHHLGRPQAGWIDSFYMTFITVATIGYGEIVDLTHHPLGRLFTVGISVIGIGTTSYIFSTFVALLLESDFNAAFRKRHMQRQIADLRGHYIVCGIGRVGTNVAEELVRTRRDVVVVEPDAENLGRWLDRHPEGLHLQADAASDEALRAAGLAHAAGVFSVTGDDSHNLMIALSVKLLNPRARVVVRVHDIRNTDKARRAGADEVVSPDFTGGMRIASAMIRPHVVNFMDRMLRTDDELRVEEVVVPAGFRARKLAEAVPPSRDYILMATHEHGQWVFNPTQEHLLHAGTALVLMTNPQGRRQLEQTLNAA